MAFILCLIMCLKMKNMSFKFIAVCSCVDTAGICCHVDTSTVTKSKQETKTNTKITSFLVIPNCLH